MKIPKNEERNNATWKFWLPANTMGYSLKIWAIPTNSSIKKECIQQ